LVALPHSPEKPTPRRCFRSHFANISRAVAESTAVEIRPFDNAVAFGVGFCFPTLTYIAMAEMPRPFVGLTNVRLPASCLAGRLCRSAFASIDILELSRGERSPLRYADAACDFERDD